MGQGIVTVTVAATTIVPPGRGHVNQRAEIQIYNGSGVTVYFGNSLPLTAGTGTPASAGMPVPDGGYQVFALVNEPLYAIVSAGTADINYFAIGIEDL